jgi:hypothetical protein
LIGIPDGNCPVETYVELLDLRFQFSIFNFIIRYPSLAYRNTMDLQVKNIILNYIYNLWECKN